jgi:hypothetical protein
MPLATNQAIVKQNEFKKNYRAKHAKLAKGNVFVISTTGELFLGSLVITRDNGRPPVILASLAFQP